jgi:Salmonella virulence plasmid 65kDa B protein
MGVLGQQEPALRTDKNTPDPALTAPTLALPRGGVGIRGIGEKFAANPVTGTGALTVPIATSPGRSGFGPQLSLSYDSGSGNGPFGFGWSLSLHAITRKTDKGVPVYRQEPDGTWVAGHPGYSRDPDGLWVRDTSGRSVICENELGGYRIRRYRPRIEGLFARIERWTNVATCVEYATYFKKSLPPPQFEYSKAAIHDQVIELDAESLENLPAGLDGSLYQWVDLDGEGVSGLLTEQAGSWFYKPNLGDGRFGPLQTVREFIWGMSAENSLP